MPSDNKPDDTNKPAKAETEKPKPATPPQPTDPKQKIELRNVQESTQPPKGKYDAG